jgi:hypothetical protein
MSAVAMETAPKVNVTGRRSNRHSKGWQGERRQDGNLRLKKEECKELERSETAGPKSPSSLRRLLLTKSGQKNHE